MNGSDTRVTTYLDDLARMLSDLDPGTRDDVLAGVREHLDAVAAEHPGDPAALEEALVRLGPPERIAAEARANQPAVPSPGPWATAPTRPLPARGWLGAGLALLLLSTVPFTATAALARIVGLTSSGADTAFEGGMFGAPLLPHVAEMIFLGWFLWAVSVAFLLFAWRLAPRTRGVLLALGPISVATVLVGVIWQEPRVVSGVLTAVLALATTGLVVAAAVSAWRERPTA